MLKDGVGRYNIFFSFLHKAWAAIIWYYGVRHGCQGFLFWKKKLSDNNNLFSKSLKNNIIVFQFFWKKMLSLPLLFNKGNSIFLKSIIFHFLKKKVCGGGVESISPRRKAFKIFSTKFGVVILKIMVGKVSRNRWFLLPI
jgi:hypothetical protein